MSFPQRRVAYFNFPRPSPGGGPQTFQQAVADTVSLTETMVKQVQRTLAETMVLTEAQAREAQKVMAETLGLSENLATARIAIQAMADTVGLSEALALVVARTRGWSVIREGRA